MNGLSPRRRSAGERGSAGLRATVAGALLMLLGAGTTVYYLRFQNERGLALRLEEKAKEAMARQLLLQARAGAEDEGDLGKEDRERAGAEQRIAALDQARADAEALLHDAEREREAAEDRLAVTENQRVDAESRLERISRQFESATTVLQRMTRRVTSPLEENVDARLRRDLLREAIALERVRLEEGPEDRQEWIVWSSLQRSLAEVERLLGNGRNATEAARRSIDALGALKAKHGADVALLDELQRTLDVQYRIVGASNGDESLKVIENSIANLGELLALDPSLVDARQNLASQWSRRAGILKAGDQLEASADAYRRSLQLLEALGRNGRSRALELTKVQIALGEVCWRQGALDQCRQSWREAAELSLAPARERDVDAQSKALSAYAAVHLSRALLEGKALDEASHWSEVALKAAGELAAEAPEDPERAFLVSLALEHGARMHAVANRSDAALEALRSALPITERLSREWPKDGRYAEARARILASRGRLALNKGAFEAAEDACAQALDALDALNKGGGGPCSSLVLRASCLCLRAEIFEARGRHDAALRDRTAARAVLEPVCGAEPNNPDVARVAGDLARTIHE